MSEENKDLELDKIKVGAEESTTEQPVIISAPTEPEAGVIKKRITTDGEDYTPETVDLEIKSDVNEDSAHDDYDWSIGNKHTLAYSDSDIKKYDAEYSETLNSISENAIVSGIVSVITDADVILDVNFKADGLISASEFRDMPELKIGDTVEVYVEKQEDEKGKLILSRRKAKLLKSWENLVDSYQNGTIVTGTIISKTKGGLIVDSGGLETFLPGSQIDIKPIIDYDAYVGKKMEFKVVKINEAIKNAVVSHKALIESDLAEQRDLIIAGLEKGQVLEGLVKNITDFGAFMDLGGVDGLLYITDISWGRISHPSEIIELNQKLNVVVLDFDENKKRISLGLKQLQSHPWDVLGEDIKEGSTVKGKIVNIEDYGAFLEITPGVEGLIHVSEVSWSNQAVNAREFFKLGTEFESKVVTIDREERKMSLSIKQLHDDPWMKVIEKFPQGSTHTGEVKNLTPYGVFVELEEGIGGMIHISDLSWTKRYSHPSEFTKVGEKIDIQILEIDQDHRKLSLGHKQLEENPWDTFENVFPIGSYHEATIIKVDDRGAIVSLPYGLEAFSPARHLKKEDGSNAKEDDKLIFKVIEFNRDDKRILVSHRRYLEDIKRDADQAVKDEKDHEKKVVKKQVESRNSKVEKTTLGELAGFSEMKSALSGFTPPKPEPAKEEPKAEAAPAKEEKAEAAPKVEDKKEQENVVEAKAAEEKEAAPAAEEKKEEPKKAAAPAVEEKKEEPKAEAPAKEEKKEFEGDAKSANIVESKVSDELEQELEVTQGKEQVVIDPDSEQKKIIVPAVIEEEEEEEDDYMPPTAATAVKADDTKKEDKKEEKKDTASASGKPDDLKKIEGIGPKIAELMGNAGYGTFAKLAAADTDKLKQVLEDAGPRYKMHSPDTWPQQAQLAADGKWDELQKLQDELDGGRA